MACLKLSYNSNILTFCFRYFHVMIAGPEDSPFAGGVFKLELFLPEEYPMAAPKVLFSICCMIIICSGAIRYENLSS